MRDGFHGVARYTAIAPQVCGTTGAANGVLSNPQNLAGFNKVSVVYNYGTSASIADTITPVLLECSTSNGSFTSVADADLLSTEAAASFPAAARTSGVGKNIARSLGYIGNKQWLKTRLYGLGTATAIVSATWEFGMPENSPATAG